jgi:hypothetical protein
MNSEQRNPSVMESLKAWRPFRWVLAVAALVIVLQVVALLDPAGDRRVAMVGDMTPTPPRPTRTYTPTPSPVPATPTPTMTATPVPPTATPTATPGGPTETPTAAPSATTVPPTRTPLPTIAVVIEPTATSVPPTATPPPVSLASSVEVDNGEWGRGGIYISPWGGSDLVVQGNDGHLYKVEMGFITSNESLNRIQQIWSYAARGGGNWQMSVLLRPEVNWVTCAAEHHVCYVTSVNPGEPRITSEVYFKAHVWRSLISDYLAGGWQATTRNTYYRDIQTSVFKPIADTVPDTPCLAFRFTRS